MRKACCVELKIFLPPRLQEITTLKLAWKSDSNNDCKWVSPFTEAIICENGLCTQRLNGNGSRLLLGKILVLFLLLQTSSLRTIELA